MTTGYKGIFNFEAYIKLIINFKNKNGRHVFNFIRTRPNCYGTIAVGWSKLTRTNGCPNQ